MENLVTLDLLDHPVNQDPPELVESLVRKVHRAMTPRKAKKAPLVKPAKKDHRDHLEKK